MSTVGSLKFYIVNGFYKGFTLKVDFALSRNYYLNQNRKELNYEAT